VIAINFQLIKYLWAWLEDYHWSGVQKGICSGSLWLCLQILEKGGSEW